MKNIRKSNFELLRIIAMILIIIHHETLHGIVDGFGDIELFAQYALNNPNKFVFEEYITIFGKVSVIIFVLITGYFSINSTFKLQKIISLIIKTYFYSVICAAFAVVIGGMHMTVEDVLYIFMPLGFQQYWFITYFILLMLIIPVINLFLKTVQIKTLKNIIITFLVIQTVPATIGIIPIFQNLNYGLNGNLLSTFILAYLIGAYLRKIDIVKKKYLNISVGIFILTSSILVVLTYFIGSKLDTNLVAAWTFLNWNIDNTFCFVLAVAIFVIFANVNIKNINWINYLSASAFSVYLIHENPFIRQLIFIRYIDSEYIRNKSVFVMMLLFIIIGISIYLICTIIDKVCYEYPRTKIFNKKNNIFNWKYQR